jgi:fructokinase
MILVIGEALIDLIQVGDQYKPVVGGANANVALALARRGEPQRFLGRISNDGFGKQIRNRLSSNSVDLTWSISAKEPTTLAIANIDSAGVASYAFYINGTADWGWTQEELPSHQMLREVNASCIQFGCLTMAIEPGNLVIEKWLEGIEVTDQITLSHDLNIRSALGFKREVELDRVLRLNNLSHIIKASDADLEWLYELELGSNLDEIANNWSQGGKLVVITRGGDGASLYRNGERLDVRAPKINLADTVGAGDTFMANLLGELASLDALGSEPLSRLERLSDDQLLACASFAAVAAGIVCERHGCEPPTRAEVEKLISLSK